MHKLIVGCFILGACAQAPQAAPQTPARIVAIGDVHGDLAATRAALRLAGAIDTQDRWIGGKLVLVQTGDQLDRGDDELAILTLLERLQKEAKATGGAVHILNGNHEIMNAALDFRYVTAQGFDSFSALTGLNVQDPTLANIPPFARARAAAFKPGGPYARKLAERPIVMQLEGNLFVHGGLLPTHATYGLERMNTESQAWLRAETTPIPAILTDEQGPLWTRIYSDPGQAPNCAFLTQTLNQLGAKRMIVGHSVQTQVTQACDGKVWRIDVGMAKAYGGPVQVLEMIGDQLRVIS